MYEYDLLNGLAKKINPNFTEKKAVYNDINNIVTIYDELDRFIKKYFDGLGRMKKSTYARLYTDEYTYDYLGKNETRTDPTGAVYTYEYDIVGRIIKSTNPDGTFAPRIHSNLENLCEVYGEFKQGNTQTTEQGIQQCMSTTWLEQNLLSTQISEEHLMYDI